MIAISVVISVFNADSYIKAAIDSVLNQTFNNYEIIIINDGSTDKTEEIIKNYSDPRINYYYQSNQGVSKSLNRALKLAKGKYIAKLDADDICYPTRLEKQYFFMEQNPNYVLCGSFADVIDENGEYIYTYSSLPINSNDIKKEMNKRNCILHSSSFYLREAALKIGGYYEPIIHYFEDYMFFYQLIKLGEVYNFPESLIQYRITPGSITSKDRNIKYRKFVNKIVSKGYITESEKQYLFKYQNKRKNPKRKLSNHYLSLSRLLLIHQRKYKKSFKLFWKSFKLSPLNLNVYVSLFFIIYKTITIIICNYSGPPCHRQRVLTTRQ